MRENILMDVVEPTLEDLELIEEMHPDASEEAYGDEADAEDSGTEEERSHVKDEYMEVCYVDSVKQYMNEIGRIPLLSAEEEKELARKIAVGGKEALEAKNTLVAANLRLVVHCAKKFSGRGMDFSDLNGMGTEGLIHAAEKFDPEKGFRFSTYATWWINQAIRRGIVDEGAVVRIPVHMTECIRKVKKAQKYFADQDRSEPTVAQIAEFTGLSEEKVLAAMEATVSIVSFDTKCGEDGDSTLEDYLADDKVMSPEASIEQADLQQAVGSVLSGLPLREAMVLKLRYGIGGGEPMTLEEIAKLPGFGITRERVRQIESRAIRMIRQNKGMRKLLMEYLAG